MGSRGGAFASPFCFRQVYPASKTMRQPVFCLKGLDFAVFFNFFKRSGTKALCVLMGLSQWRKWWCGNEARLQGQRLGEGEESGSRARQKGRRLLTVGTCPSL